jgi:general L-amino acid transport system permease protein
MTPVARQRPPFWRDARVRGLLIQLAVLTGIGLVFWVVISNAASNLALQQRSFGFGFLDDTAGFSIPQALISYSESSSYGRAMVVGLLNTLLVAVVGIVFATLLGFLVGVGRLSPNFVIRQICAVYVETVRNVPLLLQIFFWYYAVMPALPEPRLSIRPVEGVVLNNRGLFLPEVISGPGAWVVWLALFAGLGLALFWRFRAQRIHEVTGNRPPVFWPSMLVLIALPLSAAVAMNWPFSVELPVPPPPGLGVRGGIQVLPGLVALVIALSIYTAAFIAEVVRAGILGVPKGQTEAALALGLSRGRLLRLVVIPQAMRIIVPPLTSQYLNLTKNSSLAVAIAYPDLVQVFARISLNQTGKAIEIIGITMLVYLSISLLTSLAMNIYNARIKLTER